MISSLLCPEAFLSPLEIDEVLRQYPGVKVAATVGVPHDTMGEIVVACIVPEEGATLDGTALRKFAAEHLSSYKLPKHVLFVEESQLELTSSNKVKTAPLRELAPSFARWLPVGGQVVLSGLLAEQGNEMLERYRHWFDNLTITRHEDWIRLDGVRNTHA